MNLRWAPDPEAIERANAQPWGPFARRLLRPIDFANAVQTGLAGIVIYTTAGVVIVLWAVLVESASRSMYVTAALSLGIAAVLLARLLLASPEPFVRSYPVLAAFGLVSGTFLISWNIVHGGSHGIALLGFYMSAVAFGFYILRLAPAIVLTAIVAAEFAVCVYFLDQPFGESFAIWFQGVANVAVTGALTGMIAARLRRTLADEQGARTSLAMLAQDLEDQVQTQVEELERLGQLRRFLAPQIADAVLTKGMEDVLRPHRTLISVFFCDLRGFTAFTGSAEPEDVVGLLDTYYETVGAVLHKHHATIGGYAGDGIMAFFGDPVEAEVPARDALAAALEVSMALDALATTWQDRGIPVNYGVGLATGFATLGEVGFSDRVDYTALGNVVNLAARLCDKAEPGQVLMDNATSLEAHGIAVLKPVDGLVLKGMAPDTKAHTLT